MVNPVLQLIEHLRKNSFSIMLFFPYPISSSEDSPIKYDSKNIYFNSVLNKTELDYFKTLLIMYCYIKDPNYTI